MFTTSDSAPARLEHKQETKYYKGLILAGNHHKQQVQEAECDCSDNVTENLLLHETNQRYGVLGWVEVGIWVQSGLMKLLRPESFL